MSFTRKIKEIKEQKDSTDAIDREMKRNREDFEPLHFVCPELEAYLSEKFNQGHPFTKKAAAFCHIKMSNKFFVEFEQQFVVKKFSHGKVITYKRLKPYTFNEFKYFLNAELTNDTSYRQDTRNTVEMEFRITELTEITFPPTVRQIPDYFLQNASILKEIHLPENLILIGKEAFCGDYSLDHIELPETLKAISYNVFSGDKKLKDLVIPDSVHRLLLGALSYCYGLKHVRLPESLFRIPNSCFNKDIALEEIYIPDSVVDIGNEAFFECCNLYKVRLSNNLRYIGDNCFQNCTSLKEIDIPASVKAIQNYAFSGDSNLKDMTLHSKIDLMMVFTPAYPNGSSKKLPSVTLHVPDRDDMWDYYMKQKLTNKSISEIVLIKGKEWHVV